jgi:hypothetical protein
MAGRDHWAAPDDWDLIGANVGPKPKRNKDGKWVRFFIARSAAAGKVDLEEIDPSDPVLRDDPAMQERAVGQVRIENDDQVWIVATGDEQAHEQVQRTFRDIAAIAQEHMIPHKPYEPDAEF